MCVLLKKQLTWVICQSRTLWWQNHSVTQLLTLNPLQLHSRCLIIWIVLLYIAFLLLTRPVNFSFEHASLLLAQSWLSAGTDGCKKNNKWVTPRMCCTQIYKNIKKTENAVFFTLVKFWILSCSKQYWTVNVNCFCASNLTTVPTNKLHQL